MTYPPPGGAPDPTEPQPYGQDPQSGQPQFGQPQSSPPHSGPPSPYGQPPPYGQSPGDPTAPLGQPYADPYATPTAPSAPPASGQPYGGQQYGGQYPPGYPGGGYAPPRTTNVMAILSLVFAFVFAPAGIVLGHIAKKQIKERGEDGEGLATAGLVVSYIFTSFYLIGCCIWGIAVAGVLSDSGSSSF